MTDRRLRIKRKAVSNGTLMTKKNRQPVLQAPCTRYDFPCPENHSGVLRSPYGLVCCKIRKSESTFTNLASGQCPLRTPAHNKNLRHEGFYYAFLGVTQHEH